MIQDPPAKLTPEEKANWNKFIDFVELQKMKGSPILDQRNKQVGMSLLQKYNFANPHNALDPTIIPKVQQEMQDYRANLIQQWKAGKIAPIDGVKTEADIMPNLSPVDSWPGSKTLSHKFPVAIQTIDTPGQHIVKEYGTDLAAYDEAMGKRKKALD